MATTLDEVWALFREVAESQKDTDRQMKETDRQIKLLGKQIGELGHRLGEFVEGLVKPAVVRLFQARGIDIHEVYPDVEVDRGTEGIQIDLLVVNDTEAVLVEVKSKLTVADVDDHLERLAKFKRLLPRYAEVRAMGAMAAMVIPKEAARYAYRQGFLVLAQSGETVVILNDAQFQPKAW
ncbi:MAG: NERD domain-containing protein [Candidatus Competibacteraceae bacterium]|nr:NERD domain-containing protein [Candidatus Competibacteraceae bacterium]